MCVGRWVSAGVQVCRWVRVCICVYACACVSVYCVIAANASVCTCLLYAC